MSKERQASVIFVDDEPAVLSALSRLLQAHEFQVHTAASANEATKLLELHAIDVVVSDVRMPHVSGNDLLAMVAEQWPNTVRLLMTGFADLGTAIDAVNRGQIVGYIEKPWCNDALVDQITKAAALKRSTDRQSRSVREERAVNSWLKHQNDRLSQRVGKLANQSQRSREQSRRTLSKMQAYQADTQKLLSRLIGMRDGLSDQDSVIRDCLAVGRAMSLGRPLLERIRQAAMLRNVGKLAIDKLIIETPFVAMDAVSQRAYRKHPEWGAAALRELSDLDAVAAIVESHKELLDGAGFPHGLRGAEIGVPARILGVVSQFDDLISGRIFAEKLTISEASSYLTENAPERYDADVLEHFLVWLQSEDRATEGLKERRISLDHLRPGMRVSRDLRDECGSLILAGGLTISQRLIERLRRCLDRSFLVYVEEFVA